MKIVKHIPQSLKKPLYLNANLIYGECLKRIAKESWKRDIKSNVLHKLLQRKYHLVTSILTRMEIIQRLSTCENIPLHVARKTYIQTLETFDIFELTSIWKYISLTDFLIDTLATSNLDFKDALHLNIAKKLKFPLCTHDKKLRKNFSNHEDKIKFYEKVYKPEELF